MWIPLQNTVIYYYGKVNPSVLIGSYLVRISPYGPFPWKRSSAVYFLFLKASKFKTSMDRAPYNKLLTNLASSTPTGEYWPSVVFVRTSLRSVRTATISGQYSPVRPSRPVSKRFLLLLLELFSDGDLIFLSGKIVRRFKSMRP